MSTADDAIRAYIAAISNPGEDTASALAWHLEDEVVVVGLIGAGSGKQGVIAALESPKVSRLLATATWNEPIVTGQSAIVDATLPKGPLGGLSIELTFGVTSKIAFVGQSLMMAAPPPSTPVALSAEIKSRIEGALANGTPVMVSYVDAEGAPHLSPRGTVQVLDEQRLALWARDPEGGMARALTGNSRMAVYYRDPNSRISYTFSGRGQATSDPATRERVFWNSPEIERNLDGRRRGVAIVIEVDKVEGSTPSGPVNMRRVEAATPV